MAEEPLFTPAELQAFLQKPVQESAAVSAEKVAWGWLKPRLELEERPTPVPPEVFSWAIELGAIAHENPAGLSAKAIGPFSEQYSAERRREILEEVEDGGKGGRRLRPRGCFPPAQRFPDPAG